MADHQKYKITDRIDAGGMAEVFRGVAESLQGFKKNVAIKRILPHLCKNKKFISMFLDEAKLSLHLQHANIVSIFDIGVSPAGPDGESAYFIVMEYVDGMHLKGIVESMRRQGRQLTVAQVLYVMMQVCNALSYAHDVTDPETGRPLGIVHRDISPPNILISKQGEVKLVDFGLAKATSQIESTDPGVVKGKFSYLSPEAAYGREVDRRADIFAVGILMYELLTGKRLFYGDNDYQTVELVRQARVPSIRQLNPEVDADLEAVIRKALARDLNARFQTAGEMQDAIAQYLFSHGLKVISRDIAQIVQACLSERARSQPAPIAQKSLIDTLILEELNKFTSIEDGDQMDLGGSGAQPLSPDELGAPSQQSGLKMLAGGGGGGDLIDTSSWTEELTGGGESDPLKNPSKGGRPTPASTSRNGLGTPPSVAGASTSAPNRKVTPPIVPAVARQQKQPIATPPVTPAPETPEPLADLLEGESRRVALPKTPGGTTKSGPAGDGAGAPQAPRKSSPLAAILVAVVALLLVGGGAVLWLVRSGAR